MLATLTCQMSYTLIPDDTQPNKKIIIDSSFDNGVVEVTYKITGGVSLDLDWNIFSTMMNRLATYKNELDNMNKMMDEVTA